MAVQNLPSYTFDPHARVPANLITNERHTLTPKNGYTFHYIIPDYAPFYIKDLKVYKKTQQGAKTYLVEGVDFVVGYEFLQAVNSTGIPVYGAISFINRNLTGDIYLDYRTVGGAWTISQNKIAEIIADLQYNPIITTWEQVANTPYQFPPTAHSHDVKDLTSFSDLLNVLRRLGENLNGGGGSVNQQQIIDIVERTITSGGKASVGLSNLRNLEILPLNNGNNNTDNYYVTPRGVRDIISAVAMPVINQHINARGNVHGLVAADIGAVTQADIDSRLATKLGKGEKAADTVLFDGRNSQQLKTFVLDGTSSNTAKFNGLTYTEMVEDVKNRLNAILSAQGGDNVTNLAARMLQLTAGDTNKFGNRTPEQFATWLLANNNINATTLNGLTKDNLINEARSSVNATQLNGLTSAQLIAQAKQNVNAATLGGKTLQQVIADAKANVVATNASRLEGKTVQALTSEITGFVSNVMDDTKVHMGNGVNQHAVATQNSAKVNVVKIGKTTEDSGLPAVTIDAVDMGKMFMYRKALTNESINDLKQTADIGIYSQASDSAADTNLGYPDRKAGTLLVLPAAYTVQQCYFVWNEGAIFSRYAERNGTWSSWSRAGVDPSKISHSINGNDQSKIASEKAVGDLRAFFIDSRTGKIKEELIPAPKWQ
nr:MAG TPA: structural protein [Caudoviricetes sp.]DAS56564.1 MAG TPA: structural protein [Bacteriophage sp.]